MPYNQRLGSICQCVHAYVAELQKCMDSSGFQSLTRSFGCLQILEYHVYAEDAFEASDLKKHDTLVTKEGEAVMVKRLHLSLSTFEVLACSRSGREMGIANALLDIAHKL